MRITTKPFVRSFPTVLRPPGRATFDVGVGSVTIFAISRHHGQHFFCFWYVWDLGFAWSLAQLITAGHSMGGAQAELFSACANRPIDKACRGLGEVRVDSERR